MEPTVSATPTAPSPPSSTPSTATFRETDPSLSPRRRSPSVSCRANAKTPPEPGRPPRSVAEASRRRFGRRDPVAISFAHQRVTSADATVDRLNDAIRDTRTIIAAERQAVGARARAEAATADERRRLVHDGDELGEALTATRTMRAEAAAADHPDGQHLRDLIGPVPDQPAGRHAWLDLAARVDACLDDPDQRSRHRWSPDRADNLAAQLAEGEPFARQQVQMMLDWAGRRPDGVHVTRRVGLQPGSPEPVRQPTRDRGIDLGL